MRVAIIYPEILDIAKFGSKRKEFPPFGVMYLAASVEREGFYVQILKISPGDTKLDLEEFEVIAFSIPSSVTYPLVKESRFGSSYQEYALVIIGGVHASSYPAQTLADLQADVLAIGEGDVTILEILKECDTRNFSKIKGICYLENSKPVFTLARPLIKDIDILPLPARHLMDIDDLILNDRLAKTNLRMTHIMLSRGCPFSCHFCAAPQKVVQYRSGESVRNELLSLIDEYGIEGFSVVDDNSIINKEKVSDICCAISDLGLKWSTVSRVDTVDAATLRLMKKAGCIEIAFGMESGSEKILRAMNKNLTPEQIYQAVTLAHSIGIGVKVFLVHGFPGENAETTRETIDLLIRIGAKIQRVSLFRFVPLPGSYVYKNKQKYRLRIDETQDHASRDWSKFHIHNNHYHWWGSFEDYRIMNTAYLELETFVQSVWTSERS